jgi:hypothetical protein
VPSGVTEAAVAFGCGRRHDPGPRRIVKLRGLLISSLGALVLACAATNPPLFPLEVPVGPAGPRCQVWVQGIFTMHVTVVGGVATAQWLHGPRELAFMDQQGMIWQRGLLGAARVGVFHEGRLMITGAFGTVSSGPIENGIVPMSGALGPTIYLYDSACSARDAALGAYGHIVLQQEAAVGRASAATRR